MRLRVHVPVCMCGIHVSEAEVAWLFHQALVRTPAGARSCANCRILQRKELPDTRNPPKGVAGWRSLSVLPYIYIYIRRYHPGDHIKPSLLYGDALAADPHF